MATRVDKSSRLLLTEYLDIDDIEFFDLVDLPDYIPQANDIKYTIADGDRLDLIANKFYQ